jgi:hypothetical protein
MSNNNIRIVKYNEDIFKIPSSKTRKKKPDKPIKIKNGGKALNNSIKHNVLKEIRKYQEKNYNELLKDNTKVTNLADKFENDFKDSLEFMENIAKNYKETKINETIKNHNASVENNFIMKNDINLIPVNIDELPPPTQMLVPIAPSSVPSLVSPLVSPLIPLSVPPPSVPIVPPPIYGCLKNGSLPTYRTYHNKTLKAHVPALPPVVAERIKSPTELLLIEKIKQKEIEAKTQNQIKKQKKYKKLLRRTYRAGKDRYKPKVGVLLPNKTIRSNVTTKIYLLKQTPIDEVRKTLVKKGFIKAGSSAPNNVLRKIYESIQLIDGDINNHNPDYLLHNFFSENKNS